MLSSTSHRRNTDDQDYVFGVAVEIDWTASNAVVFSASRLINAMCQRRQQSSFCRSGESWPSLNMACAACRVLL